MVISGRMIWAWHWHVWWSKEIHLVFLGGVGVGRGSRLEGRRPLESPGYGWENSTGMRLK